MDGFLLTWGDTDSVALELKSDDTGGGWRLCDPLLVILLLLYYVCIEMHNYEAV